MYCINQILKSAVFIHTYLLWPLKKIPADLFMGHPHNVWIKDQTQKKVCISIFFEKAKHLENAKDKNLPLTEEEMGFFFGCLFFK